MSVYNVRRVVDTVIIEMDISTAEKLRELLEQAVDVTGGIISDMASMRRALTLDADVRTPSPLYRADAHEGYVEVRRINDEERKAMGRG